MHETIILINDDDRKDGYFQFGTSSHHHQAKLTKRIGQANILSTRLSQAEGKVTWWQNRVPIRFLSSTLGLRIDNPRPRTLAGSALRSVKNKKTT